MILAQPCSKNVDQLLDIIKKYILNIRNKKKKIGIEKYCFDYKTKPNQKA